MRVLYQGLIPPEGNASHYWESRKRHVDAIGFGEWEIVWRALAPSVYDALTPAELARTELGEALQVLHIAHSLATESLSDFDAIVIGIVQDSGLAVSRTLTDTPVVGYGQSASLFSRVFANHAGVILINPDLGQLIKERLNHYIPGHAKTFEVVDIAYDKLVNVFSDADNEETAEKIVAACTRLIERGAEVIIPGQMLLAEVCWKLGITEVSGVTVIDGLRASLVMAQAQANLREAGQRQRPRSGYNWSTPSPETFELLQLSFDGAFGRSNR